MRKILPVVLFSLRFLCGCVYDRGVILFNKEPVNAYNALNNEKVFESGDKVYYLFIAPKKMKNEYIRVQVFKMTDLAPKGGAEIVRTKDFRLMKDERYYHSDYFTLYTSGKYVMQVFSIDDLQHPLSIGDFYIK